jgi:hypothetical protein
MEKGEHIYYISSYNMERNCNLDFYEKKSKIVWI